jgi:hypothetical protein
MWYADPDASGDSDFDACGDPDADASRNAESDTVVHAVLADARV